MARLIALFFAFLTVLTPCVAEEITFSDGCLNSLRQVKGRATGAQAMEINRICAPEAQEILAEVRRENPNAVLHQVDIGGAVIEIAPTDKGPWVIGFWVLQD